MECNHWDFLQTLPQKKIVPHHISLVHVNLLCNLLWLNLLFDMFLFCRSLFLYSNLFYHHTQFQKQGATLPSNLSKQGERICRPVNFAPDLKLQFDLNNKLVIPSFIAVRQFRPDIVLYSLSTKIVIILEIICPCE